MQNFRQHVNSTVEFRPGITGIIGPNGAGKSTILEAIAWAVYGAPAARGTNDTIRFTRAAPRAKVVVDLTFELDTHEYRITRTLNSAEVYLDNGVTPVATGVGGVTGHLQNKLGMTRQEFFNTYFTGQKELQFLAQMGAAERSRFLAQVLGYERLRRAQEIAKGKRRELGAQIDGLKSGLPDPDILNRDVEDAKKSAKDAKAALTQAEKHLAKAEKDLAEATPTWTAAQEARDKAQRLTIEVQSAQREAERAQRELDRALAEYTKVELAAHKLAEIKPELDELAPVVAANERLDELSRAHARRTVLLQNEKQILVELKRIDTALEGLKQAPALLLKAQEELAEIKKQLPAAEEVREKLLKQWREDAQDNRTTLTLSIDAEKELAAQIEKLKKTRKAGNCPVCAKPLGEEYETVLSHLLDELDQRRSDIKWRTHREKQLKDQPKELAEAEKILAQLRASLEKKTEREARCEQGLKDLWERTEEKQSKEKQLEAVRKELADIPEGYEHDEHVRVRLRLQHLQEIARQARVYEHEATNRAVRVAEVDNAKAGAQGILARLSELNAALVETKFDPQTYEREGERFKKLTAAATEATEAFRAATQSMAVAEQTLFGAKRAETAYLEKRESLLVLESELRHHNEMDTALTQLRAELNARVRPELSELASTFLSDITDGRYNALEIDESYNVLVLEDGEEKPVISGGEEDVANLVLRIAISQMIAERAGQQLSTLFLDEVFGSLDLERRENVIQLLQKLHDRFEQVILITHIETVREGLDHVIRLEYDEKSGASIVKEEAVQPDMVLL